VKRKINIIEKMLAIIGLFLSTEAIFPLLQKEEVFDNSLMDVFVSSVWYIIFFISLFFILMRARKLFEIIVNNKLLFCVILFTLLSIYWSAVRSVTLRHDISFLGTVCFTFYLTIRYSWQELMKLVLTTLSICIILSCFFILFVPQLGTDSVYNGAWRGIFHHKNILGRISILSVLTWTWYISYNSKKKFISSLFIGVSFILLLKSSSTTSLLLTIIVIAIFPLYKFLRLKRMLSAALLMFGIPLISYVVFWFVKNYELIMNAMEKDVTLTGRTLLWQAIWKMVLEHPLFGYGFGAFWLGEDGPSAYIWSVTNWKPSFSHNGYMEIILQTGFIGLTLFIATLFVNVMNAIKLINQDKRAERMFMLQFLLFSVFYNIAESTLLAPKSIFWILYLAITIHLNAHFVRNTQLKLEFTLSDSLRKGSVQL
jgi:exopolysaccharide production protein ExoQ